MRGRGFQPVLLRENKVVAMDICFPGNQLLLYDRIVMNKGQKFSQFGRKIVAVFSRQPLKTILRIVLTAGFVYAVNRNLGLAEIRELLGNVSVPSLVTVFLIGIVSLFLQVLRWQVILASHTLPSDHHITMKTMFRGFLLAFVTPGRIGELFRAVSIDRKRHVASIVAVMEDRTFAVLFTVGTGIICTLLHAMYYGKTVFLPHSIIAGLFLLLFASAVIIMRTKDNIIERHHLIARYTFLEAYFQRLRELPLLKLILYSAGAHILLLVQTALVLLMFGADGFGENVIVAGQAFSFMVFIPLFIANIGLREYAFAFFLNYFPETVTGGGSISSIALGTATIILFMNIIIPAMVGLVWLYIDKKRVRETGMSEQRRHRPDTGA